ncbi:hypothetical protein [Metabacillus fastidiosus]|uniref:hypothetical protein n=1 Tax=Metabacillus fastidiosus TaxID=1458 RepID=UPI003D2CD4CE
MNLENYPRTQELLQIVNLEDKADHIKWLFFNKEDAAVHLAKAYLVTLASMSFNILVKEKTWTDQLYITIGPKLHSFAKEEANAKMGYETEDIIKLFKHISFGGIKYTQQLINFD